MNNASILAHPKKLPSTGQLLWILFIGLCLVIGLIAAVLVFVKGLSITNMHDSVPWGLWITIDLSSIALGAGAFSLSALVYLLGIKRFQPIVKLAVFVGFIGYTSALLTLVMDIGRPDRFWHPWVFWNVHSVLWEITWCITIYLTIMMLEFLPTLFDTPFFSRWPWLKELGKILHKMAPVLALLGLLISLLHQSSLGATYGIVKSRPIWFKPSMPIMFILSAVGTGPSVTMAIAIVIHWITGKNTINRDILRTVARFSGFTLLAYAYIRFWDMLSVSYYGRTPAVSAALNMLKEHTPYDFSFWVFEVGLGLVIPIVFFLTPRFNQKQSYLVLGALGAVIGVVINRWNVTVSGLFVPVSYSPGTSFILQPGTYFPNMIEWAVGIGILGYALAMLTLGVRFLPLFVGDQPEH